MDLLFERFQETFNGKPEIISSAPGRVNLIGEHTDYNEGFVFPVAINTRTTCAVRPAKFATRLISLQAGKAEIFDSKRPRIVKFWGKYAVGCAKAIAQFSGKPTPNIEGLISSEIPKGSGLSSSAAWNGLFDYGFSPEQISDIAFTAENKYVGIACGRMDQMAASQGKKGYALLIDTRSSKLDYYPLPESLEIVILDTRKPRALTHSRYNKRVEECQTAVRLIQKIKPEISSLRDVDVQLLEESRKVIPNRVIYRRARHVVTENQRVFDFAHALEQSDFQTLGELCRQSHISLKEDYEVSCRELDAMAESAWDSTGCVAARMTGAGFGGSCVALVERGSVDAFFNEVTGQYLRKGFRMPVIKQVSSDDGGKAEKLLTAEFREQI
jgi:galactokinase